MLARLAWKGRWSGCYDRLDPWQECRDCSTAIIDVASDVIGQGQYARLDGYRNLHIDLDPS